MARQRGDQPEGHARRLGIDEHRADSAVLRRVAVGAHVHEDRRVRQSRAGAPHLLTVHDEVVPAVVSGRAQRRRVGSCVGLADRDRVVAVAAHDLGSEARPLLVTPPLVDPQCGDEPSRVAHRHVEARVAQLLGDDHQLGRGRARAAELLGEGKAEQLHVRQHPLQVGGRSGVVVPRLGDLRRARTRHQVAHGVAEELLLVGESEVHRSLSSPARRRSTGGDAPGARPRTRTRSGRRRSPGTRGCAGAAGRSTRAARPGRGASRDSDGCRRRTRCDGSRRGRDRLRADRSNDAGSRLALAQHR